jgi:putative flippase GtrA
VSTVTFETVTFETVAVETGALASGAQAAASNRLRGQVLRFAAVGTTTTVIDLALFAAFDRVMAAQAANLLALILATVVNTGLNRSWTFRHESAAAGRSAGRVATEQIQGLVVFFIAWGATSGGLALLDTVAPQATTLVKVGALAAATAVSTVIRFVAMRRWIFAPPTA